MKTQNEDTVKVINHLIEICKDGAHGYSVAGKDAKDGEWRSLFNRYGKEREAFAQQLTSRVRELGGDPDKSGSVTGSLHRGWINIKAAVSSNEPHAVLEEAERGEDSAVAAYREALEKVTQPDLRETLSSQFTSVKAAHDNVRNLRDSGVAHHR